jgi:hypothetical protein
MEDRELIWQAKDYFEIADLVKEGYTLQHNLIENGYYSGGKISALGKAYKMILWLQLAERHIELYGAWIPESTIKIEG